MTFGTAAQRGLNFPCNILLEAVAALSFLVFSSVSVKAELIDVAEVNSAQQLMSSLDSNFTTLEAASRNTSKDCYGCSVDDRSRKLTHSVFPHAPADLPPGDIPLSGLAIPGLPSGAGGSSSRANVSSSYFLGFAATTSLFDQLQTGRVYYRANVEIPAAPPSELLRPPNFCGGYAV